jgi:glycosyltransferase involved in cell wall biosynthesis
MDKVVCQNTDEVPFYTAMGCDAIAIPYHLHLEPAFFQKEGSKEILSIGWLIPRKGTDLLMKAAAIILKKYPEWTWRVIGDGEMKNELLDLIKANQLEDRLILEKPSGHEIGHYYNNSSIFGLTSRMESFGMVLAEAMCHGVPGVAFDCETGPRHVITANEDGFLAEKENVPQLVEYISRLIEDPVLRKKMGEKAVANMHRFSPQLIYDRWKELV